MRKVALNGMSGGGEFCPDTMVHGECLEAMQSIEPGSVNLILTDLPYGTTVCKWDTVIPFEPLWAANKRVLKPNGAIVLTASQPFTSALVMSNPKMFKYELIWNKVQTGAPGVAKFRPLPCHETMLVFASGVTTYNPQMTDGEPYKTKSSCNGNRHGFGFRGKPYDIVNSGTRFPISITTVKKDRPVSHPTQKPVALFEYLIRTYTNPGELVLDNTSGSGTTAVAAIQSGRRYLCIEQDAAYYKIGVARALAAEQDMAGRLDL